MTLLLCFSRSFTYCMLGIAIYLFICFFAFLKISVLILEVFSESSPCFEVWCSPHLSSRFFWYKFDFKTLFFCRHATKLNNFYSWSRCLCALVCIELVTTPATLSSHAFSRWFPLTLGSLFSTLIIFHWNLQSEDTGINFLPWDRSRGYLNFCCCLTVIYSIPSRNLVRSMAGLARCVSDSDLWILIFCCRVVGKIICLSSKVDFS